MDWILSQAIAEKFPISAAVGDARIDQGVGKYAAELGRKAPFEGGLDAPDNGLPQVASLAHGAIGCGHRQSKVCDRPIELVEEAGCSQDQRVNYSPIEAEFCTEQELGLQVRVGGGEHSPHLKGAVKLVERGNAEGLISGGAQGQRIENMDEGAKARRHGVGLPRRKRRGGPFPILTHRRERCVVRARPRKAQGALEAKPVLHLVHILHVGAGQELLTLDVAAHVRLGPGRGRKQALSGVCRDVPNVESDSEPVLPAELQNGALVGKGTALVVRGHVLPSRQALAGTFRRDARSLLLKARQAAKGTQSQLSAVPRRQRGAERKRCEARARRGELGATVLRFVKERDGRPQVQPPVRSRFDTCLHGTMCTRRVSIDRPTLIFRHNLVAVGAQPLALDGSTDFAEVVCNAGSRQYGLERAEQHFALDGVLVGRAREQLDDPCQRRTAVQG